MAFRARGHGRRGVANGGGNAELLEEIIQTKLEAVELNRQRDPDVGEIGDNEEEPEEEREAEAGYAEIRLLKSVIDTSMRRKLEVPTYQGGLDSNELLD